jgi:hypothetical protein
MLFERRSRYVGDRHASTPRLMPKSRIQIVGQLHGRAAHGYASIPSYGANSPLPLGEPPPPEPPPPAGPATLRLLSRGGGLGGAVLELGWVVPVGANSFAGSGGGGGAGGSGWGAKAGAGGGSAFAGGGPLGGGCGCEGSVGASAFDSSSSSDVRS